MLFSRAKRLHIRKLSQDSGRPRTATAEQSAFTCFWTRRFRVTRRRLRESRNRGGSFRWACSAGMGHDPTRRFQLLHRFSGWGCSLRKWAADPAFFHLVQVCSIHRPGSCSAARRPMGWALSPPFLRLACDPAPAGCFRRRPDKPNCGHLVRRYQSGLSLHARRRNGAGRLPVGPIHFRYSAP